MGMGHFIKLEPSEPSAACANNFIDETMLSDSDIRWPNVTETG
jgi:hypothetical protein